MPAPSIEEAFRDYVVDGVPDSGPNKVKKSEVRASIRAAIDLIAPNIMDFGAKGDGTTNDTAAFTAAAAAASDIYVPQGTYLVTSYASISSFIHKLHGSGLIKIGASTFPVGDIQASITLNVPGTFPTLADVDQYLAARRVLAGVATKKLAAGTYVLPSAVTTAHPDSNRIAIEGDAANPASVILDIGTHTGFDLRSGHHTFRGLTLRGSGWTSYGVWSAVAVGIFVRDKAHAYCDRVHFLKIYYPIQSANGGSFKCDNCVSDQSGDVGFFSFVGGAGECFQCTSTNAQDAAGGLGFGFGAEGGNLWLRSCTGGAGNGQAQILSNLGGQIRIDAGSFSNGPGQGLRIANGGQVEANSAQFNANKQENARLQSGGKLFGNNCDFNSSVTSHGILETGGASADLQVCRTNNNALFGWRAEKLAVGTANSTHTATGNGSGTYSPTFGTIGNQGALIDN